MPDVLITSCGELHSPLPPAHITLRLGDHFRDPHIDPRLRELTARHRRVVRTVLRTRGVRRLLRATVRQVRAYHDGPSGEVVTVATGCAGGRHRSAVAAEMLARRLRRRGLSVVVVHRDIDKPVVKR